MNEEDDFIDENDRITYWVPVPLSQDVVADVRIFFNAGWRLHFDLALLQANTDLKSSPPSHPSVLLSLEDCHLTTDEDVFRELTPTAIDKNIGNGLTLTFSAMVNHMFVNDNYTDCRTRFAALDKTASEDEILVMKTSGWIPFSARDPQMTLNLCYRSGESRVAIPVGIVHFQLTPSDGLEFVLFSIVALVGIPMLLMMGFRCIASKHAFLRQHIVKCVTTNKLFTQQLIDWLNLHHDA